MLNYKIGFLGSLLWMILLVGLPVSAQNLSAGCLFIDTFSAPNLPGQDRPLDFNANEQMTMSVGTATTGMPDGVLLQIDGVLVDSSPLPGSVSWTAPQDGTYQVRYMLFINTPAGAIAANFDGECQLVIPSDSDNTPRPIFTDGRINDYDSAAPIAIYPYVINGGIGLIIYDINGIEILVISPQQIANAPDNPDEAVLIAENNGVSLHRISGETQGLWQINAPQYNGKIYVIIFSELFHGGGYESFELDT